MTNHGDDCYFYYYSTCTKGDGCPFRHCEAAMGNETVCNLWQEGRCFRTVCKFRHMEIAYNRKEIPCYWEKQPAGCQKPHCAFFHEKPRYIQGVFVPPDKLQGKTEEQTQEEPSPPSAAPPPNAANPQLRGVIKTETQEPVPSPTHPPVVINPADDDEDEEDQVSEEGEDGRGGPSPRKITKSGDSLNFGVSTLEEIRLRKALKSSMKRAGYLVQGPESSTNGEKENIHSETAEHERPRGSVTERLGRRIPSADFNSGEMMSVKKSLAQRLGRVVDDEQPPVNTQKASKPIKERLGLSPPARAAHAAEANAVSTKAPEQIRIKTLEEIKKDKAAKSVSQKDVQPAVPAETSKTETAKASRGSKRSITVTHAPIGHVKTLSEVIRSKKRKQEEQQNQNPNPMKAELLVENAPEKSQGAAEPAKVEKVRVKTLEEIRREKAARQQAPPGGAKETGLSLPKRRQLSRVRTPPSQAATTTPEKNADVAESALKTAAAPAQTSTIKVKTFEEIMQEKRLRKQEMEGQAKSSAEADAPPDQSALKRRIPASSESPLPPAATPTAPARKLICLKPRASPPPRASSPGPAGGAAAAVPPGPVQQNSPRRPDSPSRSTGRREQPTHGPVVEPAAQRRRTEAGQAADAPLAHRSDDRHQSNAADHPVKCKVRPKLNVRPSVVKPAGQVKSGQTKRGAEGSVVAAVKPMNSAAAHQSSDTGAELGAAVPHAASSQRDELHSLPAFTQIHGQDGKAAGDGAAVTDACPVPQSPLLKSPTQSKPRRSSVAASRTASASNSDALGSTMDDFEDLINQFTDDHLEEDVDPAIGEDDLLQELSELIDS